MCDFLLVLVSWVFCVCVLWVFFFFADCKLLLAKHSEYHGNRVDGKISINNRN